MFFIFQPVQMPISAGFVLDKDEHEVGNFLQVLRFLNVQQHLPGVDRNSGKFLSVSLLL